MDLIVANESRSELTGRDSDAYLPQMHHKYILTPKRILIAIAIFAAFLLPQCFPLEMRMGYSIGFLPALTLFAFYSLFTVTYRKYGFDRGTLKGSWLLILFSACCAIAIVTGAHIGDQVADGPSWPLLLAVVIVESIPVFCLIRMLFSLDVTSEDKKVNPPNLILFMIVVIACWTPYYLAAFPGYFCYDVNGQWLGQSWQIEQGILNDHHSVLHTLLLKLAFKFAPDVNTAVAIMSFGQMLFGSFVFAYMLRWLAEKGAPRWFMALSFLFIAINPFMAAFLCGCSQDVVFGLMCLLLALMLFDAVADRRKDVKYIICIAVLTFFTCALRPNGLYAVLLLLAIALIFRVLRTLAPALCIGLALYAIWVGPCFALLNVEHSDLQDANAFAIPITQISYVYEMDELSDDELVVLRERGWVEPDAYNPKLSDAERNSIVGMSKANVIRTWLELLPKHFLSFVYAAAYHMEALWNPWSYIAYDSSGYAIYEADVTYPAELDSFIPSLFDWVYAISTQLVFQNIPFAALLVYLPGCVFFAVGALLQAIRNKRADQLVLGLFAVILMASVALGPAIIFRYYYPIYFMMPILIYNVLSNKPKTDMSVNT